MGISRCLDAGISYGTVTRIYSPFSERSSFALKRALTEMVLLWGQRQQRGATFVGPDCGYFAKRGYTALAP